MSDSVKVAGTVAGGFTGGGGGDVLRPRKIAQEAVELGKVEALGRILHEAGREAVEKKLIYRDDVPVKPFAEWEDLPEPAKEGRRLQARFLLAHQDLIRGILMW